MFPNLRLLFLRFFIVVQEINYPSCFIAYYEIKQRKKRCISLFRRSHGWDWMQPRPQGLLGIQNGGRPAILTAEKTLGTRLGLDGSMVYESCHKSLKTHFDWPETLTLSCELLKLGFDWLFRPQTTVETSDNRI